MNQWYKEGLIDQQYVAANAKIKDGYMVNNQLGAMYMSAGSGVGRYKTLVSETIPGFTLAGVSFPVLKPGEKTHFGKKSSLFQGTGTAITKNNKNIVESVKWLDYKFGTEGHLLFNFGKEGTSYVMENGYPKLTSEVMKNPKGLAITQAIAQYALSGFSGPFIQDSRYTDQYYELPEQLEAQKIWGDGDNDKTIFGITFTPEEAQKIASIQNDITTYQKEMINKFIMGTEPINRFDEFVKTIKQMGIDTYAGYEQEALERYNKR
jgi:putative aldouronate transport system substrate-binding protein